MRTVRFKQVDVFTERPFLGNPVAVLLDGEGLETEEMQRIARWTNLSETTFVLPSKEADYRLRIFTPGEELPFAGHPTVGSAHAVIEAGIVAEAGTLVQECGVGLVELRRDGEGRIFARPPAPAVAAEPTVDAASIAAALGAAVEADPPPLAVDVGPVWLIARVPSVESLAALRPDLAAVEALSRAHGLNGITAFAIDASPGAEARVRLRTFAPAIGIPEDPVCGSCNAALGGYLAATGLVARTGTSYVASQGREIGRDGRVAVRIDGGSVEIGGHAVTVFDGEARF